MAVKKRFPYKAAFVACNGGCRATAECQYGCVGCELCVNVCKFEAIALNEYGVAEVDEDKCIACGKCVRECPRELICIHECANPVAVKCSNKDPGKNARRMCQVSCIGCGICQKVCPAGAITFVEREAAAYDEQAVLANKQEKAQAQLHTHGGCPGSRMRTMAQSAEASAPAASGESVSRLAQWPCQLKLVPVGAPYFDGAKLLVAADCTAYAYARMHEQFMRGKVTLIGCPKLDAVDYSEKLTQILRTHEIRSVTVVRMEVPCCGGLEFAVKTALQSCGKLIPWQTVTISVDGKILDE